MGLELREQARAVQLIAKLTLAIGRFEDAIRPTRFELEGREPTDVEIRAAFNAINSSVAELVFLRAEARAFIHHEAQQIEQRGPVNGTRVGRPR